MAEVSGGRLYGGVVDENPVKSETKTISLSVDATNRHIGISLNAKKVKYFLESIEFSVEDKKNNNFVVTVPSYRVDVSRPVDLMEEVARLSGYDNIPVTSPLIPADTKGLTKEIRFRETVQDLMTGFGFSEALCYSFDSKRSCDRLGLDEQDRRRRMLGILNPLTEDHTAMRTSQLPGLLKTVQYNLTQQVKNLKTLRSRQGFFQQRSG